MKRLVAIAGHTFAVELDLASVPPVVRLDGAPADAEPAARS